MQVLGEMVPIWISNAKHVSNSLDQKSKLQFHLTKFFLLATLIFSTWTNPITTYLKDNLQGKFWHKIASTK